MKSNNIRKQQKKLLRNIERKKKSIEREEKKVYTAHKIQQREQ